MTFRKFLIVSLLLVSYSGNAASRDTIKTEGARIKEVFVFKTDRKFLGAKVEIISARGEVLTTQFLEKRRLVIDFAKVNFGTYTIRVTKGMQKQEFVYFKDN